MAKDKINLMIPDEYYHRIGLIVTQYGQIEVLMERIIWALLKFDSTNGRLITSPMSSSARWRLLVGLCEIKLKDKSLFKKLKKDTSKNIEKIFEERNILVHGLWFTDPKTGKICCTLFRQKGSSPDHLRVVLYTVGQLNDLSLNLAGYGTALDSLLKGIENGSIELKK
jgi:hypothetical protein